VDFVQYFFLIVDDEDTCGLVVFAGLTCDGGRFCGLPSASAACPPLLPVAWSTSSTWYISITRSHQMIMLYCMAVFFAD